MTLFARPGLSISPVRPTRRIEGLARADVPVLMGYATRGPVMEPVRIESLMQYLAIFGPPLSGTHLHDAVRGFFETGGRTAYVLRVVGPSASMAYSDCGTWWRARARTPLQALGPVDRFDEDMPWFDHLRRTYGLSLPDPGAWANDLSLVLTETAKQRGVAGSDAASPDLLFASGVAGLSAMGLLRVSRGANRAVVQIARVDAARSIVVLTQALPFAGGDVDYQTVTFDAEILAQGQRVERFTDLHLVPEHPASIARRLNQQSLNLSLAFTGKAGVDWRDATVWPAMGRFDLGKGSADLAGLSAQSWQDALVAQARVDEIALIGMPDLVRQPGAARTDLTPAVLPPLTCDLPTARPKAALAGFVRDGATDKPVKDAQIVAAGEGALAVTDAAGFFFFDGLSSSLIDLRLKAKGYQEAETFLQSSTAAQKYAPPAPTPQADDPDLSVIDLVALDDIRAFDAGEVQDIQRGALDLMGCYRVMVLDPPAPDMAPEALLNWRTALGQSPRLFAVAPWVAVALDEIGTLTDQPPSGHVCGAFARGELGQGVHRAPANIPLRHAKSLTADLDEATLAAFHAASLNALRALPGQGLRLMGSRTLSGDFDWQQVSVRRLFDAIEKTLAARLAWSVFEPNSITTRAILAFSVSQFLETLRKRGMFAGTTAAEGYSVTCDGTNNTPDSAARGELTIDIGIAPSKPYEFIRISLTAEADAIEVTEAV